MGDRGLSDHDLFVTRHNTQAAPVVKMDRLVKLARWELAIGRTIGEFRRSFAVLT